MRSRWHRFLDALLAWWRTCPLCEAHTDNLEAHWQVDHAGDEWEGRR